MTDLKEHEDSLPEWSTDEDDEEVEMYTRPDPVEDAPEAGEEGGEGDVAEEGEGAEDGGKKKKKKEKKPKAPKEDPPLLARPETPEDFERFEAQAYEVMVNCVDLPNADSGILKSSLSDPTCILYMKDEPSGKWFEAGRTEKLKDTLSPEWITRIPVDYFENEDSTCKFVVYDFDKNNTDLKKATFLGQYICDFGDIIKGGEKFRQECPMTAQDGETPNKKKGEPSKIIIGALPVVNKKVLYTLQFAGNNIDKASKKGLTDAYLEMAASTADDEESFVTFHRTEVIKKTVNPEWEKFSITVNQISGDNLDRKLRISVNHWSKKGSKLIGSCATTFGELKERVANGEAIDFVLINEEKKTGKNADKYENSGIVSLISMKKKKLRTKKSPPKDPVDEVEVSARTMDITEDDEPPMRATMPIDTPDEIPAEDAEEAAKDAPEDAAEDEAEAEEEAAEEDDGQIFV